MLFFAVEKKGTNKKHIIVYAKQVGSSSLNVSCSHVLCRLPDKKKKKKKKINSANEKGVLRRREGHGLLGNEHHDLYNNVFSFFFAEGNPLPHTPDRMYHIIADSQKALLEVASHTEQEKLPTDSNDPIKLLNIITQHILKILQQKLKFIMS